MNSQLPVSSEFTTGGVPLTSFRWDDSFLKDEIHKQVSFFQDFTILQTPIQKHQFQNLLYLFCIVTF